MSEQLKFYKGMENALPEKANIEKGALYHCIDTNNTYLGTFEPFIEMSFTGYNTTSYDSRLESLGFSVAALAGRLTAGTVYKVYQSHYYALSSNEYELVNLITNKDNNLTSLRTNSYYYCTDEQKVYKTTDLMPAYELYSSAVGKRQVGGGIILDDGDAIGKHSIAGGSTKKEFVSAIVGDDLANLINIDINPSRAIGTMSTTYGAHNTSYAGGSNSFGAMN
jgi:hypothetical protein